VAEKIFSGVIPRTIPPEQPSTYLTEINFTGVRELNIEMPLEMIEAVSRIGHYNDF
jgi:hypothetical protein